MADPERIEAARGRRPAALVWLPPLVLAAFIAVSLWHSYLQHLGQAQNRALTLARAVEQHASATIDRASLSLLAAMQDIRPGDLDRRTLTPERRRELTDLLIRQHRRTRGVVSMSLTDADGVVVANSVGSAPGIDLGQRGYFLQLKAGPPDGIAISEVVKGRVSNKWGLQVARRINAPDGSFAGMTVANLGLHENFESFYATLDLGADGLITLRSQENTVLVRFPVIESALGTTLGGSSGTAAVAAQVAEQSLRSVSPLDGIDRITTVRKLPDYPVYAVAGIAYRTVVGDWLHETAAMLAMSLVTLGLVAAVAFMIQRRFAMLQELRTLSARLEAVNRDLLAANAEIERQSLQDQLTGAWNRRFADLRLQEAVAKAGRDGSRFSLLLLDLDHFKEVNDRWGHQAGDAVLAEFVRLLQARLRVNDILARWGGEEFLLLLEGSDLGAAAALAEQLRAAVEGHDFPPVGGLTVTIGVTQHRPGETVDAMIRRVDLALYDAKRRGRNQVRQGEPQPAPAADIPT